MNPFAFSKYILCLLITGSVVGQIAAQQPLEVPAVRTDSAAKVISQKAGRVKDRMTQQAAQLSSLPRQLIQPEKKLLDSLLQSGKGMLQSVTSKLNFFKGGGLRINDIHADVGYTYLRDSSGISTGLLYDMRSTINYDLGIGLAVANLPFDVRLAGSDGLYNLYNTPFDHFPQFNFNHQKYMALLQKQVLAKINPETILSSVLTRINAVKSQYETSLKNEIQKIRQEFESVHKQVISLPAGVTNLSASDFASLKTTLLPQEAVEQYRDAQEWYRTLSAENGVDPATTDSLKRMAIGRVKKYEALEKIYSKIIGWKEKFDNNSLVKQLRSHLPFTPGHFKSFIKNPSNLVDIVKRHANLGSLQQLFMNITKLDIGSNPLTGGELNFQQLMNKGINAEYTGRRSSVGLVHGSGNANINQWLQAGLNSFGSNEYSRLTGIRFGSGWNSAVKQSLSLNFFDFNSQQDAARFDPALLQSGYISTPVRRDAVITWQSSFQAAANQKFSISLSRSFGSYRNNFTPDSSVVKNNAFGDIFGSQGKSNYAASLEYKGHLLKTDLQLSFKKAGLGYSNPGSVFVRRGESRVGLSVGRKLLKQKLTLRYKTDFRSQHFDPAKKYTYTNFSNNLQLGYRLNRNNRFGFVVRHNSYRYRNENQRQLLGGSGFSLQGDASYLYRIKGKKIISHFSMTRQHFNLPMLTGEQYVSKNWLVTHTASLALDKNLLTVSLLLNRSDNKDYYFNTSFFNSEASYSCSIGKQIRLSSGAGFYANTGWNRQIGVKQQIGGTLFKKLDIDLDLSWKKAIKIIRPELANQIFVSTSVHYRF